MGLLIMVFLGLLACRSAWRVYRTEPGRRWRVASGEVAVFALIYVGLLGVLMFLENFFIYHPVRHEEYWQSPADTHIQDVWLTAEDGNRIHAWWCPVKKPNWVVLYCHGNAGNLSHRQTGIRQYWQGIVGASVLIFDYPGYGQSSGKPSEAGCNAAGLAAYKWLVNEQQVPPDQLILYGSSLGGAISVELADRHPHRALVLMSTFTSIPDMAQELFPFIPCRWLVRTKCDTLCKIQRYRGCLFIGHGTDDEVVPYRHGERLFEAATATRCKRFHCMDGSGHNGATTEFYHELRKFLQETVN